MVDSRGATIGHQGFSVSTNARYFVRQELPPDSKALYNIVAHPESAKDILKALNAPYQEVDLAGEVEKRAGELLAQAVSQVNHAVAPVSVSLNTFDLMERFLVAARGRGCQLTTIASYRSMLRPYAKKFPCLPFNPEVIVGYLAAQKKDTTRKELWKILCTFYAFVSQAEKVANPMAAVPRPKVKREERDWLTLDEVARLMSACQTDRQPALVDCYLNEALRLSEALKLDIPDVGEDVLWLDGKERGESFPLLAEVRASLLKLANGRTEGPVFINYRGSRLGRDTAEAEIRGLFRRAGIRKRRSTPHTLRHTFMSLAVQAGCNQYIAKRLLRQASGGDVSDTYSHITADHLRNALERYAPVRLLGFATGRLEPVALVATVPGVRLALSPRKPHLRPHPQYYHPLNRHHHP